jgi:hypothetical protein
VPNRKTAGDRLFESFLDQQGGYRYEFEPDLEAELGLAIQRLPDYLVRRGSDITVCEVKEFTRTAAEERLLREGGGVFSDKEVYGPIRERLRAAARGLRPLEGSGIPLVAVLTNPRAVWVDLDFDGVAHAILGNPAVRIQVGPGADPAAEDEPIATRDGVMLRERRYVSAVVVVHSPARAEVYEIGDENAPPLPKGLFDDPWRALRLPR